MSQKPAIDASQPLIDLIFIGLDHGIDSVHGGGPLTPFVLTVGGDGKQTLTRFATGRLEQSAARAQEFVAALGADILMYVIALDGYFTVDGQKFDAILIEGGERGKPFALQFAQRYRPAADDAPFETVGNPAYLGQIEQRLTG